MKRRRLSGPMHGAAASGGGVPPPPASYSAPQRGGRSSSLTSPAPPPLLSPPPPSDAIDFDFEAENIDEEIDEDTVAPDRNVTHVVGGHYARQTTIMNNITDTDC